LGPKRRNTKKLMRSTLKVLGLAALALPFAANAQPAAQDWDVSLSGLGSAQNDFNGSPRSGSSGSFGAQLWLGYFLNDNMEVGGRQSLNYASTTAGAQWVGTTQLALDYHLHMDKLVPFIGANLGYNYGTQGFRDTWNFGPEAGVKYYLQQKAYIFGLAQYQMPFTGKTLNEGRWAFSLGVGMNL
jgi:hypothetical protein